MSSGDVDLSLDELRCVTAYAIECARPALKIYQQACPADLRPQYAIEVARTFADGGRRTKEIREAAWAAQRAANEARVSGAPIVSEAARAALAAAGASYLHPVAKATQVKHILGSAAHTARALELSTDDDPAVGDAYIARAQTLADPVLVDVLTRYPAAPAAGGRVGALLRALDATLR